MTELANKRDLIQAFKKDKWQLDSLEAGLRGYRGLLRLSLKDYSVAIRMSTDPGLPSSLSTFAREITRTDSGTPLRPKLRSLVQQLLDDSELCRQLLYELDTDQGNVDPCLKKILQPMAKILAGNLSPDRIEQKSPIQRR